MDAIGAKAAGLKVAWIERVTLEAMALAGEKGDLVQPLKCSMRSACRWTNSGSGRTIHGLSALIGVLSR